MVRSVRFYRQLFAVSLAGLVLGGVITTAATANEKPAASGSPATGPGEIAPAPKYAELGPVGATAVDEAPGESTAVGTLSNEYCPDRYACFWTGNQFTGTKRIYDNPFAGAWRYVWYDGGNHRSAKNRLDNRAVYIGNAAYIIDCINPGGDRGNPPLFDRYYIAGAGSRC